MYMYDGYIMDTLDKLLLMKRAPHCDTKTKSTDTYNVHV